MILDSLLYPHPVHVKDTKVIYSEEWEKDISSLIYKITQLYLIIQLAMRMNNIKTSKQ